MDIKLDLTRHCIETESKLIYNRLVNSYFKSKGDKTDLEMAIEVMKKYLEQVDFSELRHSYPDLAGCQLEVLISISSPETVVIQLADRRIPLSIAN